MAVDSCDGGGWPRGLVSERIECCRKREGRRGERRKRLKCDFSSLNPYYIMHRDFCKKFWF